MALARRLKNRPWVRRMVGLLAAEYLRLVWNTSRFAMEPADLYKQVRAGPAADHRDVAWPAFSDAVPAAAIPCQGSDLASCRWRNQCHRRRAARHRDRSRLGRSRPAFSDKGGVAGFMEMLDALEQGWNMALTADVPKVSRVAGRGIIMLAQESGRPVFPVAWRPAAGSSSTIGTVRKSICRSAAAAMVVGDPIRVAKKADAQTLEQARIALESALNAATERAHAIVDRSCVRRRQPAVRLEIERRVSNNGALASADLIENGCAGDRWKSSMTFGP